ncbi:protein CURVATURE THYLAKOID 1C, chloroplastic isoform X2 [Tripterygium wilfordii]|uniref:protein CURVATURE THYLAKOID 1C, chloroplastic isoform X2 n=1 Tax=Tripterygium wilfordii TaxID=458696 RepID=UPI0018F7E7E9|nr:protein CURVATURE THYLAKOID 1C, chloroplastic isoform X2 [Tripterygium wilfordii]
MVGSPFSVVFRNTKFIPLKENLIRRLKRLSLASQEGSDSSTSLGIVKSVQNVWDSSEDRLGLIGLGFAAVVAFWASTNLVGVIDKVPLIPTVLELIGILFSSWFVYRYLLFKPGRGELREIVGNTISAILGQ